MDKIKSFLKFLFTNFGPIIIFYFATRFLGLKTGILLSTFYTIAEIIHYKIKKKPINAFFKFFATICILFGVIDLYLSNSNIYIYEPAFTNIITALFFVIGAFTKKPLIQEFVEKNTTFENPESPDLV